MKIILILPIVLISLTGCEVTNSSFGTPEKQALVSSGQVGVNYFQSKLNEEILKNQALERENRELKHTISRSREVRQPVVAKSRETRPTTVIREEVKKTEKPMVIKRLEEKNIQSRVETKKEPELKTAVPVPQE